MSKRFIVSLWASPRHVLSRLRGRCAELLRRGPTLPGQRSVGSLSGLDSLVHRLISGRHTVGFKRVWMLGASEERIRSDT